MTYRQVSLGGIGVSGVKSSLVALVVTMQSLSRFKVAGNESVATGCGLLDHLLCQYWLAVRAMVHYPGVVSYTEYCCHCC